ncbi:hypothetical protein BC835DRAFT_1492116 [Cytidiella melzeri]|nr:hypothetical protein BC835DRAFT_1492116 [Cytidiella melzeri]
MPTRLGLFPFRQGSLKPGPSSPLSREAEEPVEDWYIPYNGPYEPPKRPDESRDSWGALLNGILSETDRVEQSSRHGDRMSHAASAPEADRSRSRAVSGASRLTSTEHGGPSRRTTLVRNKDHARPSYIDPSHAGGVGESPLYIERTASQPLPSTSQSGSRPSNANRNSLASIFTFSRKSLRASASMDNLTLERNQDQARDRSNSQVEPPLPTTTNTHRVPSRPRAATTSNPQGRLSPEEEYYNTYYSTLLVTPGRDQMPAPRVEEKGLMRSHPYAYPFPSADAPSNPQTVLSPDKGKGRLVPRITLLDPRGPKVPAYLKPSPRSSVLKVSMSTPNLRHLPKGKQKWLSAETWCDAIILPRPRFAMTLIDEQGEGGSGRIVSPPPSPLLPTHQPDPMTSLTERPSLGVQKSLKKARSMGNLRSTPSPTPESNQRPDISSAARTSPPPPLPSGSKPPHGQASPSRPHRPKSWALDDLALPSPLPSLSEVLKEGQQLEDDRKAWKLQASRSFLDKRAGSISRSRSKSTGSGARTRSRARSREGERTTAFEALAERTLLGGQIRHPTIHVHAPPSSKSGGTHSRSQSHTQTTSQSANTQSTTYNSSGYPVTRSNSRRARSHAHSNSLGQTTYNSSTNEGRPSHTRTHSLGKTAFKIVVSTATSAAAFCGLSNPMGEKGVLTPGQEKSQALEGAIQTPGTKHIHLHDQIRAEEEKKPDAEETLRIAASPSAMLAMIDRSHGISPTPSAQSGSGEGVGIAISSPSADNHPNQQGRQPIRLPAHPYALNSAYVAAAPSHYAHPSKSTSESPHQMQEETSVTSHRQPVLLHPYAQATHPYATASHSQYHRPNNIQPPPPHLALYAELTPNHIRQFGPEALRYSPDIPTPITVKPETELPLATVSPSAHPYRGAESKRTSELGFGDVLNHTLRSSIDSGLGTSEAENFDTANSWNSRAIRPDSAMDDIARIHDAGSHRSSRPLGPRSPPLVHATSSGGISHSNTTASSPPEHLNPPIFRHPQAEVSDVSKISSGIQPGNSSGSSPGAISHDSSPPLSPRVINTSDDLERFRDLFYKPEQPSKTDETSQRPSMASRQASGSIVLDVGSRASTRSGLSTLAYQLSEELEELRQEYGASDLDHNSQRSWGRRFGGLRGPRPDEMDEDPNVVLAQLSVLPEDEATDASGSPVQMPIDITFVSPPSNIPEDVGSSRASSILHLSPLDDNEATIQHFRLGEVEAVSTPPITTSAARFSAELSLVEHDNPEDNTLRVDTSVIHRLSERSTLLSPRSPYSPNTRSSYRTSGTDISRMSGLSDFPAPPTLLPISSRLQYVHHHHHQDSSDRPRLEREPSSATFGRADDDYAIGQAL